MWTRVASIAAGRCSSSSTCSPTSTSLSPAPARSSACSRSTATRSTGCSSKFKSINDTYGHIQGDAALVRIADALRLGARDFQHRVNIARYGGDEFVILANADDIDQIDALRDSIDRALTRLNREANAPYELSVSMGAARADPSLSLKELIEKADEQLYEEKERRHAADRC